MGRFKIFDDYNATEVTSVPYTCETPQGKKISGFYITPENEDGKLLPDTLSTVFSLGTFSFDPDDSTVEITAKRDISNGGMFVFKLKKNGEEIKEESLSLSDRLSDRWHKYIEFYSKGNVIKYYHVDYFWETERLYIYYYDTVNWPKYGGNNLTCTEICE